MNIRKRIEKLEEVGVKIAEEQGNLAWAAKACGVTVEDYKDMQRDIASLPYDELLKLAKMGDENKP